MNNAEMMLPEKARPARAGKTGLKAMNGISTMAVSGVKMKPIAARCGSRL